MGTITLGGVTYIQESVADETIPAHNYDDMINVSDNEDLDAWIARISAEWDNIPPEIKEKIVAGIEKEIGNLSGEAEFFDGEVVPETEVIPEENMVSESSDGSRNQYASGVWYGNVITLADGSTITTVENLKGRLPVSIFKADNGFEAFVSLSGKIGRAIKLVDPLENPTRPAPRSHSMKPNEILAETVIDEAQKDMEGNEMYDFAEGRRHAASMPDESLEYVRQDLINVITVQEQSHKQGHHTPKLGYYWDEYWTVMDEIAKRMKKGQKFDLKPWSLKGNAVDSKLSQLGN